MSSGIGRSWFDVRTPETKPFAKSARATPRWKAHEALPALLDEVVDGDGVEGEAGDAPSRAPANRPDERLGHPNGQFSTFDYYEPDLEPSPDLRFLSKRFSATPK